MRIGFISTDSGANWSGSEELWAACARAALDNGHQVVTLTQRWCRLAQKIDALRSCGATVLLRNWKFGRTLRLFERHMHILPRLVRWRPDILCVSLGCFLDVVEIVEISNLLDRLGVPYVVVCQLNNDLQLDRRLSTQRQVRQHLAQFLLKAISVGFVSESNRISAERHLATPLPNSCVLCNPVNLSDNSAVTWPAYHSEARLACVGRLQPTDKGQDVLIETLAGDAWQTRSWRLSLYGEGKGRPYLEELVARHRLGNRILFHGPVSDIRRIWAENHILTLPSRREGLPLALVEAMLCARPSVVTDVGGNADWIDDSHSGFIAEAPTVKYFSAALERAWAHRNEWHTIGETARRAALRCHDANPGMTLLKLLENARGFRFATSRLDTSVVSQQPSVLSALGHSPFGPKSTID